MRPGMCGSALPDGVMEAWVNDALLDGLMNNRVD